MYAFDFDICMEDSVLGMCVYAWEDGMCVWVCLCVRVCVCGCVGFVELRGFRGEVWVYKGYM